MLDINRMKGVIFDMDGTLIDSDEAELAVDREVCRHFYIQIPYHEWANFKGRNNKEVFQYIFDNFTDHTVPVEKLIEKKQQLYLKEAPSQLKLISGAQEFLAYAKQRFHKIGLATSSDKLVQEAVCNQFGIEHYFDAVVTGEEVREGKPSPEPYLVAAKKLGLLPQECLVIEDADNGVRSAKAAHCMVIALTTTMSEQELLAAGADKVVWSFADLKKLFDEIV